MLGYHGRHKQEGREGCYQKRVDCSGRGKAGLNASAGKEKGKQNKLDVFKQRACAKISRSWDRKGFRGIEGE